VGEPPVDLTPAIAETHSGIVFFVGDRAYKLKKAVDLGFLDFRTREAREAVCHREVELNRRLAPDVYVGVSDVLGVDGEVCDHLVVLRRMPDDRRLSSMVLRGDDVGEHLRALARLLADFHAAAERSEAADRAAGADALAARWSANTAGMHEFEGRFLDSASVARADQLAHRYLDGRRALFEERIAAGRACDGHGDLLADDIFCLDDGPRVLDCLEFDDALRLDDPLADVAFLAMDLERLGRPDLGTAFLDDYRAAAGDAWPPSLAHHHVAYRAQVRAKVSAIRAAQGVEGAGPKAEALLDLCLAHLEAARVRLVLVGGLPGTGKSTLAAGLGAALGAEVLRSDVIRKELAGLQPDESGADAFGEGIYTAAATDATYDELLARAREALAHGRSVVLDASWSSAAEREGARAVAEATSSDMAELRCVAPAELAAQRLRDRAARGGDPSDADPGVAAAMADATDPWTEATDLDTRADPDDVIAAALASLPM
jgi:aminoglycoside phosphotransferase family enzyme/predicted kinase